MAILIIKRGASGDVIRTTVLLHFFKGQEADWLTSDLNVELLRGLEGVNAVAWKNRGVLAGRTYDLAVNLEDDGESAAVLDGVNYDQLYGAYRSRDGMRYTDGSAAWFDLGVISKHGIDRANELKLRNRESYQRLLCRGLGFSFVNEPYLLPPAPHSELAGDVAVSAQAGAVWPMKNWAFYPELIARLQGDGLVVNELPQRAGMLGHIADIGNHQVLVSGDSLPMHCALGRGVPCVTLFICTSPWEIHGYGIQEKIVSPGLERYFYRRDFDPEAARSISLDRVYDRVKTILTRARQTTAY